MPAGKLKNYTADKGFGFISPDDGTEDIFAHTGQFSGNKDSLRGGEKVMFEWEWDEKRGKKKASSWSVTESGGSSAPMSTGRLKKYLSDKGFGFISPDDNSDDIFAHSRQYTGGDPNNLRDGDKVRYEKEWDGKNKKYKASTWCTDSGGGPGGCGGPPPGYGHPPPQGYGGPAPFYGAPPPGYYGGPPPGAYGPMGGPPPGGDPRYQPYGGPPPGAYGGMPGYGAPPPGYGAPQPGYGAPPAGYGGPAPGLCGGPAPGPCGGPAPGPCGGPLLPAGWEQHTDPASGKPYFCNRATGETSWTPPAAPAPAPAAAPPSGGCAPPLPPGWEQANDPASGKPYYFNRATNETKWERPA